jgi:hypothetical protein
MAGISASIAEASLLITNDCWFEVVLDGTGVVGVWCFSPVLIASSIAWADKRRSSPFVALREAIQLDTVPADTYF